MKLRRRVPESDGERVVSLVDEEATALLAAGDAVLERDQVEPPNALLDLLEPQLSRVAAYGPAADSPKCLATIASELFAFGVRQNVVAGQPVRWHAAGARLSSAAESHLCGDLPAGNDLLDQARTALQEYLTNRAERITGPQKITSDDLRRQRLVRRASGNFLDKTWQYWRLVPAWYEYRERLTRMKHAVDETIEAAISEGRILCAQDSERGASLVHPAEVVALARGQKRAGLSFCFSADLPDHWFFGDAPLHRRRNQAGEWMVRVVAHFARANRRPTREDLIAVAMDKFGLKRNAAEEAYKAVAQKLGAKLGRVPDVERVKINEIIGIE